MQPCRRRRLLLNVYEVITSLLLQAPLAAMLKGNVETDRRESSAGIFVVAVLRKEGHAHGRCDRAHLADIHVW